MRLAVPGTLAGAEVVLIAICCLLTTGCTDDTVVILLGAPITGAETAIRFTVLGVVKVLVV